MNATVQPPPDSRRAHRLPPPLRARRLPRPATGVVTGLLALGVVLLAGWALRGWAHSAIGTPPNLPEEYFSGGRAGTVFATTSRAMELPAPAIANDPERLEMFLRGEEIFNADYVTDPEAPFGGLGPVYNNTSCMNCHPNYGRARRVEDWKTEFGNGYIAFVHTPDGQIVDGYQFMLQTLATPPYQPPAKGVDIEWVPFVDDYGNRYPDGTPYNAGKPTEGTLTYPEETLVEPLLPLPEDYQVSLEATIGLYGTGLLDAIPDEAILAEAKRQQSQPGPVKGEPGPWIIEPYDGEPHLGKFAWHGSRATLQNGPGFNGSWSVYNITREDKPALFASQEWIDKQAELGLDIAPLQAPQPVEMTQEDLEALMLWSRTLGVPAARDLSRPEVKRGRALFHQAGCASCHRPSWTTGEYDYVPAYSNQSIRPYTDMLLHDMGEENAGRFRTYRTPPLWGRGLMEHTVNHTDMFHDLRARDFEEAILWHFGEAEPAREFFRNLPAADRQALIEFIRSI
jgi:CxxC motif-containing protein (DUF1111 family)